MRLVINSDNFCQGNDAPGIAIEWPLHILQEFVRLKEFHSHEHINLL